MIYFVFAVDPTTEFLRKIIDKVSSQGVSTKTIECRPSDESYERTLDSIKEIPDLSTIVFLGHGRPQIFFGGAGEGFPKKKLIELNEMVLFKQNKLLAVACDSVEMLKSSNQFSGIINGIGFKGIPTEIEEIESNKHFRDENIFESDIEAFKKVLVEVVSHSLIHFEFEAEGDFFKLFDYLILLINKEINEAILKSQNRNLADLLFHLKIDMKLF
jgi:hypothetical protein